MSSPNRCNPLSNPTVTSAPLIPQRAAGRDGSSILWNGPFLPLTGRKSPRATLSRKRLVKPAPSTSVSQPKWVETEGHRRFPPSGGLCASQCPMGEHPISRAMFVPRRSGNFEIAGARGDIRLRHSVCEGCTGSAGQSARMRLNASLRSINYIELLRGLVHRVGYAVKT
jgi:hypothetical protein